MGVLRTIAEVSENLGGGTADLFDNLAEGARQFACDLWADFPDQLTKNKNLQGSFSRGFLNRLCNDRPPVTPPSIPFSGGQCSGVEYTVTVHVIAYNITTCNQIFNSFPTFNVFGAVRGIVRRDLSSSPITTSCNGLNDASLVTVDWVLEADGGEVQVLGSVFRDTLNQANPPLSSAEITSVVRTDGQPDTCGDPDLGYPVTNPDASDYTSIINLGIEDGEMLSFPITYTPFDFNFPLVFDIQGINLEINLGGFEFNFSPVTFNGSPFSLPDGQDSPLPAPQDDQNRFINPRPLPKPDGTNYDEEVRTDVDPKEEEVGEEIAFVRVSITGKPSNAKNQWGDGAPNVYYSGWFEFQSDSYNFPRQPIHFDNTIYARPEGATGYAYTLYEGFTGFATLYKFKLE